MAEQKNNQWLIYTIRLFMQFIFTEYLCTFTNMNPQGQSQKLPWIICIAYLQTSLFIHYPKNPIWIFPFI